MGQLNKLYFANSAHNIKNNRKNQSDDDMMKGLQLYHSKKNKFNLEEAIVSELKKIHDFAMIRQAKIRY